MLNSPSKFLLDSKWELRQPKQAKWSYQHLQCLHVSDLLRQEQGTIPPAQKIRLKPGKVLIYQHLR